ncbi:MAG: hypothetical protein ABI273_03790 [Lacunisphaera sp.]
MLFVFAGCAVEPWATDSERRAYGKLVENSRTYRLARAASPRKVIWYVEQAGEYPQIYVGFDMGTHSAREATLRIRDGVVERLVDRGDDDFSWVVDE